VTEPLLILMGETASGKSELALHLAERYDAEIIGADSRQIYRDMEIGTAAPTAEERARVPHHGIAFLAPHDSYSAARFVADTLTTIAQIRARHRRVIVVGGTGFYIRALCGDMLLAPAVDTAIRARIRREAELHAPEWLHAWLALRDPVRAAALHPHDTYRVQRALELCLMRVSRNDDTPPPADRHASLLSAGLAYHKVWVRRSVAEVESRIASRVERMFASGIIAEAERVGPEAVAATAVGYPAIFAYLAGQMSEVELRRAFRTATSRYAKRQRTWLRTEPNLVSLDDLRFDAVERRLEEVLGWSPRVASWHGGSPRAAKSRP